MVATIFYAAMLDCTKVKPKNTWVLENTFMHTHTHVDVYYTVS